MTKRAPNHVLYRFYDDSTALLYVGITANPSRRLEKHRHDKDWWSDVARIDIEHFPDRATVLAAERTAIETEHPRHNIRMNGSAQSQLEWICELCDLPVADGDGYITLSFRELAERNHQRAAHNAWIENEYGNGNGWTIYPISALLDYPSHAEWRVLHRTCDSAVDEDAYWFDVDRIRTLAEALGWTAHLLEKKWLQQTNWRDLMEDLARRCGSVE